MNTTVRQLAEAGATPLPRMGKEVAIAPVDADFSHAARWSIQRGSIRRREPRHSADRV